MPNGRSDAITGNNTATDVDTLIPATDLSVTKTDGQTAAVPGQVLTSTIVVQNAGPNAATAATVLDPIPSSFTAATWLCSGSGGGTGSPIGSGSISDTVNLPVNASVTYTLNGMVAASPTHLRNTATVTPPAGMGDLDLSNNSATDDDTLFCFGETIVVPDGRLAPSTIGAGATAWFAASLSIDNSCSLAFENTSGETPPGTVTLFAGDDGCSMASTLATRDTTGIDPRTGAGSRRVSFIAPSIEPLFRARLEKSSGTAIPFSFSWSANTAALGTPRGRTGPARFAHDGPPGAVLAGAAIANFATSPAYVQPVKFETLRESR